jgi:heterodisulfide reductase subunit A
MVSVGQHERIELLSYSEVVDVQGYVGNFKVKVRRKPRYIVEKDCTGCAECEKVCPVSVPSEFDLGLGTRKAVYRPFPQAVPASFTIDKRGTSPCRYTCPAHQRSQGYIALIKEKRFEDAYRVIKEENPFPAICGRICDHRCEEECSRGKLDQPVAIRELKRFVADWAYEHREELEAKTPVQADPPEHSARIAIVGSGPAGLTAAQDLVMLGYRVTVFEALPVPGGMLRVGVPEYRLPREIIQWEIEQILAQGVELKLNTRVDDIDSLFEQGYDAVFLAVGTHVGKKLPIPGADLPDVLVNTDFLRRVNLGEKVDLSGRVVLVLGGGNVACDCARTALRLGAKEVHMACLESREEMPAHPWEVEEAEEEGIIIHPSRSFTKIISEDGRVKGVECLKVTFMEFDEEGRLTLETEPGSEHILPADTVIFAIGQAPDLSLIEGDERIRIKRGTIVVDPNTLATERPGVFAGGDAVTGTAFAIDAIAAGHKAARSIDRYLRGEEGVKEPVLLPKVELSDEEISLRLADGLAVERPRVDIPSSPVEERKADFREINLTISEEEAIAEAERCLLCGICSECLECERVCGPECIVHEMGEETLELEVGTIILATGFSTFDPKRAAKYGYGLDNVLTGLEFERLVHVSGPTGGQILLKDGRAPESVAIIHCVGSRDEQYNAYCSRVCCMYSMKLAHLVRESTEARVYEVYKDLRAFGKGYEEFYKRVEEEGVTFIHGEVTEVVREDRRLVVRCEETFPGQPKSIAVDMVVLAVGVEPRPDAADVASLFGISRSADGFFLEKHPKLAPVDTASDGIFVAGACQGPKDIPDTVAQAGAAAAAALAMMDWGEVAIEPFVPEVRELWCVGCGLCVEICPFQAIELVERRPFQIKAQVSEVLCKGCGLCVAACRGKALSLRGFNDQQLLAEMRGLLQ